MRKPTTLWTIGLALALLALPSPAGAQVNTNPPGVARASFIRGDVSMQRGDSGDASAVELNTPLVAGDKVFTGSRSRAEIQLDWANSLRLDENAEADIATLDRDRIQVQLAQGLAYFSVLKDSESGVEIDTPNVSISPRREGRYRIEVTPSGDTLITIRDGEADISTPDGSTIAKEGQTVTVRGTGNDAQFQITRAAFTDEFDRWNTDRDRIIANAESYRRTNRYYTGAADLDSYGRWDRVPDYGDVWVPRVAVGWAPYRHGRWVWTAYWGWTWTADEPWGWAPYHYGRWFVHRGSWVWWPGPVTRSYRPVYAPAYVSFFGFGSHSGVSIGVSFGSGFGSIGWLPAGPCDYVNPWWGSHRNTFNVVNVTNITNVYNVRNVNVIRPLRGGDRESNIHNMLANNQVRYGLSTVDAEHFGRGRANVRTVSASELREGRFMTGNVPVVPSRESLRASDRTVNTAASRLQTERQFFSRRMPSNQRETFADESARVQQAIGRDERLASASDRAPDNRPGNTGGFGTRNGNAADLNSQRQSEQASRTPRSEAPAANAGRESAGGWRSFGSGQTAAGDTRNNQPQREPVVRAPRQRSSSSEASPNRPESQAGPDRPAQNGNGRSETQPGFSRFSSQRVQRNGAEQFIAQNSGGNQQSEKQAKPNSGSDRPNAWQRFTGGPRPSPSAGGNNANTQSASPRNDARPQLRLNRPIIQPRDSEPPRDAGQMRPAPPRDSGDRGFAGAPRGALREPAPSGGERFAPAPRSAPAQPSSPGSSARPSAPRGNSQSGSGGRTAPSGSSSRARGSERSPSNR